MHDRDAVARRIRFVRGAMSQAAFAERIGVSRSAVANYETGRTVPPVEVLKAISEAFGLSSEFLKTGDVKSAAELATAVGLSPSHPDTLTEDEWAIARVLRLTDPEVVTNVVRIILDALTLDEEAKRLADPMTIEIDVARLLMILERRGQYHRGISRGNVDSLVAELARRLKDAPGGPQ